MATYGYNSSQNSQRSANEYRRDEERKRRLQEEERRKLDEKEERRRRKREKRDLERSLKELEKDAANTIKRVASSAVPNNDLTRELGTMKKVAAASVGLAGILAFSAIKVASDTAYSLRLSDAKKDAAEMYNRGEKISTTDFFNVVNRGQNLAALEVVSLVGTQQEKDALERFREDRAAAQAARENHTSPPPPLFSKEDQIVLRNAQNKYSGTNGGQIGQNNINSAIKNLNSAIEYSNKRISIIDKQINDSRSNFSNISKESTKIGSEISAYYKAKKELSKNISGERRKELNAIVKNTDIKNLKQQHAELVKARKDLSAKINSANAEKRRVSRSSYAIQTQRDLLVRNKSLISQTNNTRSRFDKMFHSSGKYQNNKYNKNLGKSSMMFINSISRLQRQFSNSVNKGNAIHAENMRMAYTLKRAGDRYLLSLKVANTSRFLLMAPMGIAIRLGKNSFRHFGAHTRLGSLLNSKFSGRGLARLRGTRNTLGKMGGRLLRAPGRLLGMPNKLMNMPRDLANKLMITSAKATRKVVTTTAKTSARVARFGIKKASKGARFVGKKTARGAASLLGKTRIGRKLLAGGNRLGRALSRFGGGVKRLAGIIASPAVWLKNIVSNFFQAIARFILGIINIILLAIGYILLAAFVAAIVIIVLLVILALLMSLVSYIMDFIDQQSVKELGLVKNNPGFIAEQVVNYRNAETEILDSFNEASQNNMMITKDPIYYILNGDTNANTVNKIMGSNKSAKIYLDSIVKKLNAKNGYKVTKVPDISTPNIPTDKPGGGYHSVKLNYYHGEDVYVNKNGGYSIKKNAKPSKYEISNAQDAFALVDSLYTSKSNTMELVEVLAYLGVGDWQLKSFSNENKACNSLFWSTHKFIYNSGTKEKDIWYHATVEDKKNPGNYIVDPRKKYTSNNKTTTKSTDDIKCEHQQYFAIKYEVTTETKKKETHIICSQCKHDFGVEPTDEEFEEHAKYDDNGKERGPGNQHLHSQHEEKEVEKTEKKVEKKTAKYYICLGHIDLDVSVGVTSGCLEGNGEFNEKFFDEAMNVEGLTSADILVDDGLFGFVNIDPVNENIGFGSIEHTPFNPKEDWGEKSEFRDLAMLKTKANVEYSTNNDFRGHEFVTQKHVIMGNESSFSAFKVSDKKEFLFGQMLDNNKFYSTSFVSGAQKNIQAYILQKSNLIPKTLDIKILRGSPILKIETTNRKGGG